MNNKSEFIRSLDKEDFEKSLIKFNIPDENRIDSLNGEGVWGWVTQEDREKYDAWQEILDTIDNMDKYELPPEEETKNDDFAKANEKGMIKICNFEKGCKLRPDYVSEDFITNGECILYGIGRSWKGWGEWWPADNYSEAYDAYKTGDGFYIRPCFIEDKIGYIPNV